MMHRLSSWTFNPIIIIHKRDCQEGYVIDTRFLLYGGCGAMQSPLKAFCLIVNLSASLSVAFKQEHKFEAFCVFYLVKGTTDYTASATQLFYPWVANHLVL